MTPRPPTAKEARSGKDWRRTVAFVVAVLLAGFVSLSLFPRLVWPLLVDVAPGFEPWGEPDPSLTSYAVASVAVVAIGTVVMVSVIAAFESSRFAPDDE